MQDCELLAEHLRAIEYLLAYGTLTEADRTVARARLCVIVGKLRQPQVVEFRELLGGHDERDAT